MGAGTDSSLNIYQKMHASGKPVDLNLFIDKSKTPHDLLRFLWVDFQASPSRFSPEILIQRLKGQADETVAAAATLCDQLLTSELPAEDQLSVYSDAFLVKVKSTCIFLAKENHGLQSAGLHQKTTAIVPDAKSKLTTDEDDTQIILNSYRALTENLPFKIIKLLGHGGMGNVFLAEQSEPVKRLVALKFIKNDLLSVESIVRFRIEQQTMAILDHPGIAQIFDVQQTTTGTNFLTMEYVEGTSIRKHCQQRSYRTADRIRLFIEACEALRHAHQRGIIHRDLKSPNILVTKSEPHRVKLIDFGLAKSIDPRVQLHDESKLTQFGQVLGSFAYMSPEHTMMSTKVIDTRSDIFSMGVVLFELLTGTTPLKKGIFRNQPVFETLQMVRDFTPVRPSDRISELARNSGKLPDTIVQDVKGELDWVVMKATDPDPDQRYQTIDELINDLRNFQFDKPVVARPPSKRYRFQKLYKRNKGLFAGVGIVFIVLLSALIASLSFLNMATRAAKVTSNVVTSFEKVAGTVSQSEKYPASAFKMHVDNLTSHAEQSDIRPLFSRIFESFAESAVKSNDRESAIILFQSAQKLIDRDAPDGFGRFWAINDRIIKLNIEGNRREEFTYLNESLSQIVRHEKANGVSVDSVRARLRLGKIVERSSRLVNPEEWLFARNVATYCLQMLNESDKFKRDDQQLLRIESMNLLAYCLYKHAGRFRATGTTPPADFQTDRKEAFRLREKAVAIANQMITPDKLSPVESRIYANTYAGFAFSLRASFEQLKAISYFQKSKQILLKLTNQTQAKPADLFLLAETSGNMADSYTMLYHDRKNLDDLNQSKIQRAEALAILRVLRISAMREDLISVEHNTHLVRQAYALTVLGNAKAGFELLSGLPISTEIPRCDDLADAYYLAVVYAGYCLEETDPVAAEKLKRRLLEILQFARESLRETMTIRVKINYDTIWKHYRSSPKVRALTIDSIHSVGTK